MYECEIGGLTPQQALGVLHHAGPPDVDDPGETEHAFVIALVRGAMQDRDALDERIGDAAKNWRVERMAILDRLVMRLALQELLQHRESPPRVVISEAIELARSYSGEEPRSSSTACSTAPSEIEGRGHRRRLRSGLSRTPRDRG